MLVSAALCLAAPISFAQPGIITTVVGTGISGFAGDGGQATMAEIKNPTGTVVDKAGNLYVCDRGNYYIRKVGATTGIITPFAGNGTGGAFAGDGTPATASGFAPSAICMDTAGNFYFTDDAGSYVYKIDTASNVYRIAGTGSFAFSGDGGPATAAALFRPNGIAVDNLGNIYISDFENNRIRVINSAGTINTLAGNGTAGYTGDGGAATAAELRLPFGVAVDKNRNVYIADGQNNRIRKVNTAGTISTYAGNGTAGFSGDGMAANAAEISSPEGIAVDTFGNVYISDFGNNRIRKVNTSFIISTICGDSVIGFSGDGGPATAAELSAPDGVYVTPSGIIYICDYFNYRIRKVFDNHLPKFVHGNVQTLAVCKNSSAFNLDSMLAVTDSDMYETETWTAVTAPPHGVLMAAYIAASDSGTVVPMGMTYMPYAGYVGTDSFQVSISDGYYTDTATIRVNVVPPLVAGAITGIGFVCATLTDTLHDTTTGGVWTCKNADVTVSSAGVVTGVSAGVDTVFYTVSNVCGSDTAQFVIHITSYLDCIMGIAENAQAFAEVAVYPNPNTGSFTLGFGTPLAEKTRIVISNLLGNIVAEYDVATGSNIEISSVLPSGIYLLTINNSHLHYNGKISIHQ